MDGGEQRLCTPELEWQGGLAFRLEFKRCDALFCSKNSEYQRFVASTHLTVKFASDRFDVETSRTEPNGQKID